MSRDRTFTVAVRETTSALGKPAIRVTVRETRDDLTLQAIDWPESPEAWSRKTPDERAKLVCGVLRTLIAVGGEPLR